MAVVAAFHSIREAEKPDAITTLIPASLGAISPRTSGARGYRRLPTVRELRGSLGVTSEGRAH
jgi:hypothetical protein